LEGVDLSWARLEQANLEGATLDDADLSGAKMDGATLSDASLERVALAMADLNGASLGGARMRGVDLTSADLREANLLVANLEGADVSRADFRNADWSRTFTRALVAYGADLRGASNLTQDQLDEMVGDEETLLPDGPAPDTGKAYHVWTCWQQSPPDLDAIVELISIPATTEMERVVLRLALVCGTMTLRSQTGTPLAIDKPRPPGHPLGPGD